MKILMRSVVSGVVSLPHRAALQDPWNRDVCISVHTTASNGAEDSKPGSDGGTRSQEATN